MTPEQPPWGIKALLYVLINAWPSVFADVLAESDRRHAPHVIKRLIEFERSFGRSSSQPAEKTAAALEDAKFLLMAFPLPEGGRC